MSKNYVIGALAAAALMLTAPLAVAADISGAGATFPYPIYAKWADSYKTKTGIGMNYQSIGSGGGIKQIQAKTVDFGATDAPLSQKDLDAAGLLQFPAVMGGIVPVINVKGIAAGELKLSGPVLADIYLTKIKKWNDPAIAKLNAGMKLPADDINVVNRSDGSGTTFVFTDYLSQVSPEWKTKVGSNASVEWPGGVGGKGNEGVANYVKQIDGAIGYVEYVYAKQNKLTYAQLENKAGKFVQPTIEGFMAAAAKAPWSTTPGFAVSLNNESDEKAWPITSATFILVYKNQTKPEVASDVLKFFNWAYSSEGAKLAEGLDYIPMPDNVVKLVQAAWGDVKGPDGKPVAYK